MSAFHINQDGNDLFIRKGEAHIMNRNKKEKSVLRREGNVYVLDLFVKVLTSAGAPIKYKPMEVVATSRVADAREREKRVTFSCNS